jgi:hypothetical protein
VVILLVIGRLRAADRQRPARHAAEVLTLLPFSSPVLMPMRYMLGGASTTDVVLSLAI